jgi:hypothetical protein
MKNAILIVIFLLLLCAPLAPAPMTSEQKMRLKPETAMWLEPVLPGIVFFNRGRPVAGSLMLAGRIVTLAGAVHFHNRYADYASAERAARIADLYYGPGLQYRDPYSGGYKTTTQFRKEADRNLNLAGYSVGIHLILLGVGMYNGLLFAAEDRLDKAPVYEAAFSDTMPVGITPIRRSALPAITDDPSLPGPGQHRLFEIFIPLDF